MNDDHEVAEALLLDPAWEERARGAGITVLVDCGVVPGLSGMLVRHAGTGWTRQSASRSASAGTTTGPTPPRSSTSSGSTAVAGSRSSTASRCACRPSRAARRWTSTSRSDASPCTSRACRIRSPSRGSSRGPERDREGRLLPGGGERPRARDDPLGVHRLRASVRRAAGPARLPHVVPRVARGGAVLRDPAPGASACLRVEVEGRRAGSRRRSATRCTTGRGARRRRSRRWPRSPSCAASSSPVS